MKIPNTLHFVKRKLHRYKVQNFYRQMISKDDLCFDIGANLGEKSRLFLSIGAKVVAFEPQRSCYDSLSSISSSKFTLEKCAIGSRVEQREFHISSISDISTFSEKFREEYASDKCSWEEVVVVPCYPIAYFFEKYGVPTFCKIDVEGLEWEIISGMHSKVPFIEFENTPAFKQETIQCVKHLAKMGYVFKILKDGGLHFSSNDWLQEEDILEEIEQFAAKNLHSNIFCKQREG